MFDTSTGMRPLHSPWGSQADLIRVITTPLLLMDLLLTAGLPWPTILYTILIDEIMIITGLIGALVASSYKVLAILLQH